MHGRVVSSQEEPAMFVRLIQLCSAALLVCAFTTSLPAPTLAANDGIVRVKSAYPMGETMFLLFLSFLSCSTSPTNRTNRLGAALIQFGDIDDRGPIVVAAGPFVEYHHLMGTAAAVRDD